MKILNKFCYDKIFTFFTMIKNNDVHNLFDIVDWHKREGFGSSWDKPEFKID